MALNSVAYFGALAAVTGLIVYQYRTSIFLNILRLVANGSSYWVNCSPKDTNKKEGLVGCIGNTPLVRIKSLSEATGCEIFGKAEFLNPGGSVKDRVALRIIEEAIESGKLEHGGLVTEGSAGSTGISLAMVSRAFGCRCFVSMPDDAATEKSDIIEALGAEVARVRPVSITHPEHFVNIARKRAMQESADSGHPKQTKGFFADQFENLANFRAHYTGTGKEIWQQTGGHLDAFICAAGTGGTIAGVSRCLKSCSGGRVQCYLVDPAGSSLFLKVTRGVMFTAQEAEGRRLRHPNDTITEGIGINRMTANMELALPCLDGAFQGTDREAVEMARFLLREDGLFVGSSSAMNCVGAVKLARVLGKGKTIVTILCDGGQRHLSKFHNPHFLASAGLTPSSASGLDFVS